MWDSGNRRNSTNLCILWYHPMGEICDCQCVRERTGEAKIPGELLVVELVEVGLLIEVLRIEHGSSRLVPSNLR